MIALTVTWSTSHDDGTWTNEKIELTMPAIPRIGDVMHIDDEGPSFLVHRRVEGILHQVDTAHMTHVVVRLKS